MPIQLLLVSNLVASGTAVHCSVAVVVRSTAQKSALLGPANHSDERLSDRLDHTQREVNGARVVNSRLEPQFRFRAASIEVTETRL